MNRKVGLWIDHKKAIVVSIKDDETRIDVIESKVEPRLRLSGGSRSRTSYGPQDVASEAKRDRKYRHHLDSYYGEVIQAIHDADAILVFGPGEAKGELEKAIQASKEMAKRVVGVEPADKMTERQIAAKVRDYFTRQGRE